ncbi:hypothetical protein COX53_00245 [candidate division WWE3 bacterium CG23_combo_of_CG06-09_8_20_14_all_40_14]|uniref:Uncharacterized protein n=1 Tax=candidate division WWE3 bacterium CG23_combo_of_CG06-09_8_20_14_all_40_14 TaxID=1975095 RepID=A0A2G9XCY7_UNCKA|nr:MAG: hypothetical protein COX53_00245 [candidate division WWE3 bacterium CG23_combo_of_CG06-09_8_20_14_all_40_14]
MYKNLPSKSKTLTKLIDKAILPAIVLTFSKIISLIIVNQKFRLNWQVGTSGIIYTSKSDFVLANTYSSLFMYFSIMAGLLLLLIKAVRWHSTHIDPKVSARLHFRKLDFLVTESLDLYLNTVIWLGYSWLAAALMLIQSYYNLILPWVSYIALFVSITATIFVLLDIEREFGGNAFDKVCKRESISFLDLGRILKSG